MIIKNSQQKDHYNSNTNNANNLISIYLRFAR